MGSYCKYCNTRCFKPTNDESYIKTDLEATCEKGIEHDMNSTYPKLYNKNKNVVGWLLELNRDSGYSLFAEMFKGKVQSYEIDNNHFEEILDFTLPPKENLYYRLIK